MIQYTNLKQLPYAVNGVPSWDACGGEDCSRVFLEWAGSVIDQQFLGLHLEERE